MADTTKLHELLAVKSNLETQAATTRNELQTTFEKKGTHFTGRIQTFTPNGTDKEGNPLPKVTEQQTEIQTSIMKELEWIKPFLAKAIDVGHRIDIANTTAKADVELEDGTVFLKDVPVTFLLQLEKTLTTEVLELVKRIPTLDPAKGFKPDEENAIPGVYKARDHESVRTAKEFGYVVMVQPTDKHPAQVKELMVDKPTGTLLTQEWSSLITPAAKSEMLARVDNLIRAVKKARSRANEVVVDTKSNAIGEMLLNYVFTNGHSNGSR